MNAITSLCRMCSNPDTCALCDIIRRPRPLSSKEISRLSLSPRAVTAIGEMRKAELQRQIDAERARNEALKRAAGAFGKAVAKLQPAHTPTPNPDITAPAPEVRELQPAPAPRAAPLMTYSDDPAARLNAARGAVALGDWAALDRMVSDGLITEEQAREIGAAAIGGATARA